MSLSLVPYGRRPRYILLPFMVRSWSTFRCYFLVFVLKKVDKLSKNLSTPQRFFRVLEEISTATRLKTRFEVLANVCSGGEGGAGITKPIIHRKFYWKTWNPLNYLNIQIRLVTSGTFNPLGLPKISYKIRRVIPLKWMPTLFPSHRLEGRTLSSAFSPSAMERT